MISLALLGSRGIPARYGGFETVVEILARQLPKKGFRITVFCERSLKRLQPRIPGTSLVYFPVFEPFRIISEVAFDVVALMWSAFAPLQVVVLFGYTASIFCLLPRLTGRSVVINVDGLEWKRKKFARPVQSILKLSELIATKVATKIICDSRAIQDYYRRRYSAESTYLPNPVSEPTNYNPGFLEQLGLTPGSYYLVVARLEPENHTDMIIAGLLEAKTSKKLIVVGPNIRTRFVESLHKMATEQIRFVGGVYEKAALNTLRRESYAYVHGHEVGGTNPSLLESMVAGSPIVALDVPYNREVARDAALYFKNQEELAKRIRTLEDDEVRRKSMGTRAKRIALEEYPQEQIVNRYAQVIAEIASHDIGFQSA